MNKIDPQIINESDEIYKNKDKFSGPFVKAMLPSNYYVNLIDYNLLINSSLKCGNFIHLPLQNSSTLLGESDSVIFSNCSCDRLNSRAELLYLFFCL
jgi:hypothetical protein